MNSADQAVVRTDHTVPENVMCSQYLYRRFAPCPAGQPAEIPTEKCTEKALRRQT